MPEENATQTEQPKETPNAEEQPNAATEKETPGGEQPTETPANEAGKEPEVPETPEEKAARLELELAHAKGKLEALQTKEEPEATEEPTPEEQAIADIDAEMADLQKKLESPELQADQYDDADKRVTVGEKRGDIKDRMRDLKDQRRDQLAAKSERERVEAASGKAYDVLLTEAMAAQEVPTAQKNALAARVQSRMGQLGYVYHNDGKPPMNGQGRRMTDELFSEIVHGQAAQLARGQEVRPLADGDVVP